MLSEFHNTCTVVCIAPQRMRFSFSLLHEKFISACVAQTADRASCTLHFDQFPTGKTFQIKPSLPLKDAMLTTSLFSGLFLNVLFTAMPIFDYEYLKGSIGRRSLNQHEIMKKVIEELLLEGHCLNNDDIEVDEYYRDISSWRCDCRTAEKQAIYNDYLSSMSSFIDFSGVSFAQVMSDSLKILTGQRVLVQRVYPPIDVLANLLKESDDNAYLKCEPLTSGCDSLAAVVDSLQQQQVSIERRLSKLESKLEVSRDVGSKRAREARDRAYPWKIRDGVPRGEWCEPGRVVGYTPTGLVPLTADCEITQLFICASQPDVVGEIPDNAKPERWVVVASVGRVPVIVDDDQLEIFKESDKDMFVSMDQMGRLFLSDLPVGGFGLLANRACTRFDEVTNKLIPYQNVCGITVDISPQVTELIVKFRKKSSQKQESVESPNFRSRLELFSKQKSWPFFVPKAEIEVNFDDEMTPSYRARYELIYRNQDEIENLEPFVVTGEYQPTKNLAKEDACRMVCQLVEEKVLLKADVTKHHSKTQLISKLKAMNLGSPSYNELQRSRDGLLFVSTVTCDRGKMSATSAPCTSKAEAESDAAAKLLSMLTYDDSRPSHLAADLKSANESANPKSRLYEIAARQAWNILLDQARRDDVWVANILVRDNSTEKVLFEGVGEPYRKKIQSEQSVCAKALQFFRENASRETFGEF